MIHHSHTTHSFSQPICSHIITQTPMQTSICSTALYCPQALPPSQAPTPATNSTGFVETLALHNASKFSLTGCYASPRTGHTHTCTRTNTFGDTSYVQRGGKSRQSSSAKVGLSAPRPAHSQTLTQSHNQLVNGKGGNERRRRRRCDFHTKTCDERGRLREGMKNHRAIGVCVKNHA